MTPASAAPVPSATSTLLADYDYALPPEAIAQEPRSERDRARMLVLERATGTREHTTVTALPGRLRAGDLLVVNDTRVMPARLRGRLRSGGAVELLVVEASAGQGARAASARGPGAKEQGPRIEERDSAAEGAGGGVWRCLGRPGKRLRPGTAIVFAGGEAEVVAVDADGLVDVAFPFADFGAWLERHGEIPLPPYIRRSAGPTAADVQRYQTMFADPPGSVAAPTAGLHFTPALVASLQEAGIAVASVTLHVGPGTFLPVRCADARDHRMLPERYFLSDASAAQIRAARERGGRVVAVGTTTTRALESAAAQGEITGGRAGWADCFLYPGVEFRVVDALFTNFHLPKSTLLLLVSAFAGREAVLAAYADALAHGYRFYSYGDAMLIL